MYTKKLYQIRISDISTNKILIGTPLVLYNTTQLPSGGIHFQNLVHTQAVNDLVTL